ncbi:MAG: hypothetical protein EA394_05695 [Bacteroidia bacterium]|nr:MAG: hypothetical protein EA394_05695 [Bacteroidia bacterium]
MQSYFVLMIMMAWCTLPGMSMFAGDDHHHENDHHHHRDHTIFSGVSWHTRESLFSQPFHQQKQIDTTLTDFQHYDFFPVIKPLYAGKGNVGHAVRPLMFEPLPGQGFRLHSHQMYQGHLLTLDSVRFYRPEHVYSELFYVLGAGREQLFYAMHNQRLHEHVYGGILYQTTNSPGHLSRLRARNAGFSLSLDAQPFEGYQVAGSLIINRIFNDESGGLADRLGYEEDEGRDFMRLTGAQTRLRELGFRVEHSYQAGFHQSKDEQSRPLSINLGQFRHAFTYQRRSFVFDESTAPSSEFFGNEVPVNPGFTYDSTLVHTVANELNWTSGKPDHKGYDAPLYIRLFVSHEMINVRMPALSGNGEEGNDDSYPFERQRYNQLRQGVHIASNPRHAFSFEGYAHYIASGYNAGDSYMGGHILLGREKQPLRLKLHAIYAEQEAPYFYNRFRSNYVSWNNDFRKTRVLTGGASVLHSMLSADAGYTLMNKAVYMDEEGYPRQNTGSFSVITAGITTELSFSFIRSKHRVQYQYFGDEDYDRFPSLVSYHSLYADFKLFDGVLKAHTGVDLRHNNPYRPMAYMPVNRHFHIQNHYESDRVFLLDVFANAMISRARLFIKLENILGLFSGGKPVYDIPFYPLPETAFKFGISWMFFD